MNRFDVFADARTTTERGNRRRLIVFLGVFCAASAAGLAYEFVRPAEYRAIARLQITPASYQVPSETTPATPVASPSDSARPFLTEVERLSSRPLLERVANRLTSAGQDLSTLGPDPVAALQAALTVKAVPGTHVVELAATGPTPELPTGVLVSISEEYRKELAHSFAEHSGEAMARANDEVNTLEEAVVAKRREVEAFRMRYNIVSPEREENETLAQLQGLGKSLQAASDRVSTAEGRLSALREAAAAGRGVVRAKDNPTLIDLEKRASRAKEDLRNLERSFTPDYLALDPSARQLRARLAEMERQIKVQRAASQKAALDDAEEELASAREAERRLKAQIAAGRQGAGQFAARFEQYKELQSELSQLASAYQDAQQQRARLEATERARVPSVQVLEQAALPREAWRPRYWRDAGILVGGALVLALCAMWVVELFNRPEPQPSFVLTQPIVDVRSLPRVEANVEPALGVSELPPALPGPAALPRELSADEVRALLNAGEPRTLRAILLLLSGISPEEAVGLRWADVDWAGGVVHVGGTSARAVHLNAVAAKCLSAIGGPPESPVLGDAEGRSTSLDSLSEELLCAAHDAGLERVQEVTPHALRHTYIAFLVRQGIRFADLARIVGKLPGALLATYSALAPEGARVPLEAINVGFPSLANFEPK